MITKKPKQYIGVKVINGNDTIEFVFYISLFVLVLFYLFIILKRYLFDVNSKS